MATDNPFSEDYVPPSKDRAPQVPISGANPFEPLPVAIGADTSEIVRPNTNPYSAFNTVGRMASDALLGLPDTINMAARGLNYGIDYGLEKLGLPPPPVKPRGLSELITGEKPKGPDYGSIPYIAPILRKAVGVAELPEDAGLTRSLLEGGGSALLGGVGSATTRAIGRGVKAAPEVIGSILNPSRVRSITDDVLEKSGGKWYKALDQLDVRYHPDTGPHMADAINRGAFKPAGITTQNAPRAIDDVNKLRSIDPEANVPYGTVKDYIVPRDIESVRQDLNHTRATAWQPGSARREGEAANTAISGIDSFLHNPPKSAIHPTNLNDPSLVGPVLANARADTAASHRLGFLTGTRDEIGTKLAAKPNASGSVEAQALRDKSAAALNSKNLLYGFNDYEKQLIENASKASWLARYGANAPKSLTGALMQGGGVGGGAFLAGLPHSVSAAIGAAVPASEYAAKKLADFGTRRAYQRAADAVAARSPLAADMGIPAPPTGRLPVRPSVTRDDIAAALAAQAELLRAKEYR